MKRWIRNVIRRWIRNGITRRRDEKWDKKKDKRRCEERDAKRHKSRDKKKPTFSQGSKYDDKICDRVSRKLSTGLQRRPESNNLTQARKQIGKFRRSLRQFASQAASTTARTTGPSPTFQFPSQLGACLHRSVACISLLFEILSSKIPIIWQESRTMTQRHLDTENHQGERDSSNQDETLSCDNPPAYESLEIVASTSAPSSQKPISGPDLEGIDGARLNKESLYTWSNCEIGKGWGVLVLEMVPNPKENESEPTTSLPWAAGLTVKCRDVPRLMREGLFWAAENVLPEEGHMSSSTPLEWSDLGFRHARMWSLADKSNGATPLWVARLEVFSRSVPTLSGFQLQNLSRENVHRAHARNAEKQLVYGFEFNRPGYCYNCIYNDMPLQGWWPWPRPREGRARDVGISGPAVEPEDVVDGLFPLSFSLSQHECPQLHQASNSCVIL